MATPQKGRPGSLAEALAHLKRDPAHPAQAVVDDMEVELRVVDPGSDARRAASDDVMDGAGPWTGETTEELLHLIRLARERDDAAGEQPR